VKERGRGNRRDGPHLLLQLPILRGHSTTYGTSGVWDGRQSRRRWEMGVLGSGNRIVHHRRLVQGGACHGWRARPGYSHYHQCMVPEARSKPSFYLSFLREF